MEMDSTLNLSVMASLKYDGTIIIFYILYCLMRRSMNHVLGCLFFLVSCCLVCCPTATDAVFVSTFDFVSLLFGDNFFHATLTSRVFSTKKFLFCQVWFTVN